MSQEDTETIEGRPIGWVDVDENQQVVVKLTNGEDELTVGASNGPGRFVLVRTEL